MTSRDNILKMLQYLYQHFEKGVNHINVGILGTGFGAYHAELFSSCNDVETIYMFGRNPEKLKELESKYGIRPVLDINEIIVT